MYTNNKFDCISDWIEQNKMPIGGSNSLKILQWNIRGINDLAKFDCVGELLQRCKKRIDIVILCETWVKSDRTQMYKLDGYTGVFSSRSESHGGLAVFMRNGLIVEVCQNRAVEGFHHIHCQLLSSGKRINFHAVYRPPSYGVREFLDNIENMLSVNRKGDECIIVGDMNVPINMGSNNVVQEYLRLLISYNVVVSNTHVTRPSSCNVLDHVICSENLANTVINDTVENTISDHCLIMSSFNLACVSETCTLQKEIVDHSRLSELFVSSLVSLPDNMAPGEKLSHIVECYRNCLIQCTRTVSIQAKVKGHCPWMTIELWKLISIKDRLFKRHKIHPNDQHTSDLLDHVSKLLLKKKKLAKRNYYHTIIEKASQSNAWKVVNEVVGKNNNTDTPNRIWKDGVLLSDQGLICSAFNSFFCNIGAQLAATIPSARDPDRFRTTTGHSSSIYLSPATLNETITLINDLKERKSPGPDMISAKFIKIHYAIFAPLLTDVFNEMISTGNFPECLKVAKVIPIFKSGDPRELNNYRPISCLSVLDKILEKMLACRIMNYASHFGLIFSHQYGFRKGSGTLSATCDLVEGIYESLDAKRMVGAVFIDLKKAFDTINHELLLEKLELFGIRGTTLTLLESYLTNRQQFVSIGNTISEIRTISSGVPQGSNLGPLLFLLFINDICKLNLKGEICLFADDTSLFYKDVQYRNIQQQMDHDLNLLYDYFCANKLSLNLKKTKCMFIHSPRRRFPPRLPLTVHGVNVEEVHEYVFLGLTIDSTMSWSGHIRNLKKKLSSICGALRRVSNFIPGKWLMQLYYTLVHSRLSYLVALWGSASKSILRELQVVQNRCLKIALNKPFRFSTAMLYSNRSDNVLPIKALYDLQTLTHVHRISHDPSLHHNIAIRRIQRSRASRQAGNFSLVRPNTEMGRKKLTFYGFKLHNDLRPECKSVNNISIFKKMLTMEMKQNVSKYLF